MLTAEEKAKFIETLDGTSYVGEPRDNTFMFIKMQVRHLAANVEGRKDCLIFAEHGIEFSDDVLENNTVVFYDYPQYEYALFAMEYRDVRMPLPEFFEEEGYYITSDSTVGENCTIYPGCFIGPNVHIGNNGMKLLPETLSIEDFLGITSPENGGRLRNVPKEFTDFTEQYVKIYETLKDSLVDEKGNQISLKDYLKELESLGEFSHTKDQPFKQFLSALLDITIVVPFIEMCTGEDFITDEDLSDFERGMKGVSVVLGIFTLGQSGILEMPFKEGLMSLGKFAAVDAASTTASYWTGYACNEMGLPLPLTILLSTAMGMGVSSGMSKIINNHIIFEDSVTYKVDDSDFEKNLKRILKENNMTLDDFDRMKLTNQSELTHYEKHVMRQIRESIPMPDSNTLMQKAIPIGDVEKYMDGTYKQVGGYVSRAQDVVSLNSYDEIYESLRLDYPNTAYQVDTDEYMAVIRFKTDDVSLMDIPYGHEFGGDVTASQPFTGNGFLKSTNGRVIPEYKCGRMNMQEGAEIIRIGKDGSQKLLGVYSEAAQEFIPVN